MVAASYQQKAQSGNTLLINRLELLADFYNLHLHLSTDFWRLNLRGQLPSESELTPSDRCALEGFLKKYAPAIFTCRRAGDVPQTPHPSQAGLFVGGTLGLFERDTCTDWFQTEQAVSFAVNEYLFLQAFIDQYLESRLHRLIVDRLNDELKSFRAIANVIEHETVLNKRTRSPLDMEEWYKKPFINLETYQLELGVGSAKEGIAYGLALGGLLSNIYLELLWLTRKADLGLKRCEFYRTVKFYRKREPPHRGLVRKEENGELIEKCRSVILVSLGIQKRSLGRKRNLGPPRDRVGRPPRFCKDCRPLRKLARKP